MLSKPLLINICTVLTLPVHESYPQATQSRVGLFLLIKTLSRVEQEHFKHLAGREQFKVEQGKLEACILAEISHLNAAMLGAIQEVHILDNKGFGSGHVHLLRLHVRTQANKVESTKNAPHVVDKGTACQQYSRERALDGRKDHDMKLSMILGLRQSAQT